MKKAIILSLLIIGPSIGYAQQKPSDAEDYYAAKSPLVFFRTTKDTIKTIYSAIITSLNANAINTIVILKDTTATRIYGELAKNGVLIVDFKPYYHFPADQVKLSALVRENSGNFPIYIDGGYIEYPDMLYVKRSDIKSIGEATEKLTGAKYINVVTRDSTYKPGKFKLYNNKSSESKPGQIMIR